MNVIRGKIEHTRELKPKSITFGKMPYYKLADGSYIDKKTGKKVQVEFTTIGKELDKINRYI